ncbi:MAG: hypothetical protein QW812_03380 [Thermoplasmataceae archaeon]
MDKVEDIASSLKPGQKIVVYPLSVKYGDEISSFAEHCLSPDFPGSVSQIEIEEPFEAVFLRFDGQSLYLATNEFSCIRIAVAYIKQITLIYS